MALSPLRYLAAAAIAAGLATTPAASQDANGKDVPERVLFVTSGGYWESAAEAVETAGGEGAEDDAGTTTPDGSDDAAGAPEADDQSELQRGYYRLIAIRGEDNRSRLALQEIALTPEGPKLVSAAEVPEINALGAYITDIRPENSTGRSSGPGFAAFIYLKTDPDTVEPDTWTLFVDEFGDILVEPSSN